MSASKLPFIIRWRNGVMDDANPVLTWRALVAAMPLTRHANARDGRDCYPGAKRCAAQMRVSEDTIQRGWAELVEAGWLEVQPLPASRRASQGALKVLRWPKGAATTPLTAANPLTAPNMAADSGSTIPGNQGSIDPSLEAPQPEVGKPCRRHPAFDLTGWDFCPECERDEYQALRGIGEQT
jgi:hypothetical protein